MAQPKRHPDELSTEAARDLIDAVARANPGIFIITGGDPMQRDDLLPLVRHASGRGLRVALSPSATPRFLEADLRAFRKAGVRRISFSLDGATEATHDAFRGVPGTAARTYAAIAAAQEAGIGIQINTTITRQNLGELEAFRPLLVSLKPETWTLFLLVPTGRGKTSDLITASEAEALFLRLAEWEQEAAVPFRIKTTEGQHYRRVSLQRWAARGGKRPPRPLPIGDGKGFVFISHTGEVYPSGFLPLSAGNVKEGELLDLYRDAPLFRSLRAPDLLKGKCGRCDYRSLCGGSRARAHALTGDPLASDPLCLYEPSELGEPHEPTQPVPTPC